MKTALSDAGYRYRISLRGECGPLVAGLFGDVAIESGQGWTWIIASVRDESELYGLLDRFQDLALHLVSLNELGVVEAAVPAGSGAVCGDGVPERGPTGPRTASGGRPRLGRPRRS